MHCFAPLYKGVPDSPQSSVSSILSKMMMPSTTRNILSLVWAHFIRRVPKTDAIGTDTTRSISSLIVQFIKSRAPEEYKFNFRNAHSFFKEVETEMFANSITWGRVSMFLSFALRFALFLESDKKMVGAADSVLVWTCQTIEKLDAFFQKNNGWVS